MGDAFPSEDAEQRRDVDIRIERVPSAPDVGLEVERAQIEAVERDLVAGVDPNRRHTRRRQGRSGGKGR